MTATVQSVKRDLTYLEEAWPALVVLKIPGTDRAWVETPRRTGVLSETDAERLGKKGVPRPTPVDVGVLDLLALIASRIDEVTRTVAEVAVLTDGLLPSDSAAKDPRPWIRTTCMWLAFAHEADDRTAPWIGHVIAPLVTAAARLLGDARDGQVMNGVCPWCDGRTMSGVGERTMQIYYPDPDDKTDRPLIICHGIDCDPPRDDCGERHNGKPAWPRREWDWLSKMLREPVNDEVRAMACT